MSTGTITATASLAGVSIQSVTSREATGQVSVDDSLAAADPGELTTRTSDTAGTLTMDDAGHGIETGDTIDVFWDGGCAYDATAGTVAGTSVPFTGASGDVLPIATTECTADVQEEHDVDFDGDKLEIIAVMSTRKSHVTFLDSGSASLEEVDLTASELWQYVADTGQTNPLAGNPVDKITVSNGNSSNTATFKLAALYNSDT